MFDSDHAAFMFSFEGVIGKEWCNFATVVMFGTHMEPCLTFLVSHEFLDNSAIGNLWVGRSPITNTILWND